MTKPDPPVPPGAWRKPVQERGRQRAEAILDAARTLVIEHDVAGLKMSDVAKRADIPIGSVYQYFPTRSALLSKLFEDELAPIDDAFRRGLGAVVSWDDLVRGVDAIVAETCGIVHSRPCLLKIWSSTGIDPVIQEADLRNTLENAGHLARKIREVAPSPPPEEAVFASAVLICHSWGGATRLSFLLTDPALKAGVLRQFSHMMRSHLAELAEGKTP